MKAISGSGLLNNVFNSINQYGFQLPANQIRPAIYESYAGIKAVIDRLT